MTVACGPPRNPCTTTNPEEAAVATTQSRSSSPAPDATSILHHHLGAFAKGVDEILVDYTDRSVLVTPDKTYRGAGEIRGFFESFMDSATKEFWDAFVLGVQKVEGDVAYITWWSKPAVTLATDTLVVRDGKIAVQTFTSYTA
jgi:hypothetical protein